MLEDKNQQTSNLEELGEFGLIDRLTEHFNSKSSSTIKAIGDDAAVIDNGVEQSVVSTDMLVEGIHFDVTYVPLQHLGYKAVVVAGKTRNNRSRIGCVDWQLLVKHRCHHGPGRHTRPSNRWRGHGPGRTPGHVEAARLR